ncbi:MAG: tetratricopeptide repeat protein [Myxococcales bacterium]|nr:tetratricopeptide repeat protein [Myxococcales bacterium]
MVGVAPQAASGGTVAPPFQAPPAERQESVTEAVPVAPVVPQAPPLAPTPRGTPASAFAPTIVGAAAPATPSAGITLDDEIDLPAPRATAPVAPDFDIDLPAPKAAAPIAPDFDIDIDLPAPKAAVPITPDFDIDLPAPKAAAPIAPDFEVDLPAPKLEVDLPTPRRSSPVATSADFGDLDLPVPKINADLPVPKVNADLPIAKQATVMGGSFGNLDLPTPKHDADLPVPRSPDGFGSLDLPTPRAGDESFADLNVDLPDLPLPNSGRSTGGGLGDMQLPPPKPSADLLPPKQPTVQGLGGEDESSFGDLGFGDDSGSTSDLPPSLMSEDGYGDDASFADLSFDDDSGELPPLPPTATAIEAGPMGGGLPNLDMPAAPTAFGHDQALDDDEEYFDEDGDYDDEYDDDDYDDDYGEADFDDDEDMEFGIDGSEDDVGIEGGGERRRRRGQDFEAREAARRKRRMVVLSGLAATVILLAAGGAALSWTPYGIYGQYLWEGYLPEAGSPQFARSAIEKAEKLAMSDTYPDALRSLSELGSARKAASLNRDLWARSIVHEALFVLRFGDDTVSAGRAAALTKRLNERSYEVAGAALPRAAEAARKRDWAAFNGHIQAARGQAPRDPYVELLAGEAALAEGKLEPAKAAFEKALSLGAGTRAQWGLVRILAASDDLDAQSAAVDETLKQSPKHVEARIAEARILWQRGRQQRAMHLLRVALGLEPTEEDSHLWSSKKAIASGFSVLGFTHESNNRLSQARKAYETALESDPYLVEALLGSGRVALDQMRFNDGLARFQSALSTAEKGGSDPIMLSGRAASAEAQLGISRSLLLLKRGAEARGKLTQLSEKFPNDPEITLVLGDCELALDNIESAEIQYRRSIELARDRFDGYLHLANLFFAQKDPEKASEILLESAEHVEDSAEMRRMLGHAQLERGQLESAVHEFERALELNPHDLQAMFGMGKALRRNGKLAEASQRFDQIAKRDPAFAGLAEERGLLHEARGEFDEAVAAYKAALDSDEGNSQLLLRMGAAQVAAGNLDEAEQTLEKVVADMPNSHEAEYFIGRIQFARGRTADALTYFTRALGLDGTKGEYHLYAARAALEMKNVARALEEADAALSFDPSLGDAYWVRARIGLLRGTVKDALKDASRALELNPARIEAHIVKARSYAEMRDLSNAIASYRAALKADEENGEWWFQLATVYNDAGNANESFNAIQRAVRLGDAEDPVPYWLPEALHLAGAHAEKRSQRPLAIKIYKRYLEVAPETALDLPVIQKKLKSWGVELGEQEL